MCIAYLENGTVCVNVRVRTLKHCCNGRSAVYSSTTRCKQRYTGLSHAFTHCLQSPPLIHRNTVITDTETQALFALSLTAFCCPSFLFKLKWQLKVWQFLLRKQEEGKHKNPCREKQRKGDESIAITFHIQLSAVQEDIGWFFYMCFFDWLTGVRMSVLIGGHCYWPSLLTCLKATISGKFAKAHEGHEWATIQ